MTKADLPFELWRIIFEDVYATKTVIIPRSPSDFALSKLHSRLNIYRCLASVSKSWRLIAQDVFFEDLQVYTIEALQGLVKFFGDHDGRRLALAVSCLDLSFPEFRDSVSIPRRPRPLLPFRVGPGRPVITTATIAAGIEASLSVYPSLSTNPADRIARYRRSDIEQADHWSLWQEDVAKLLMVCSSASHVSINFTSTRAFRLPCLPYLMEPQPPLPDLSNSLIAEGLLKFTNLKSLTLVDPSPLQVFDSAFSEWKGLQSLDITLTSSFRELPNTAFLPLTRSLHFLRFYDLSTFGNFSRPLSSDMGKCTNLQVLVLCVSRNDAATRKAIAFLCSTCQHTLRTLILRALLKRFRGSRSNGKGVFYDMFRETQTFHFENLKRLHLPDAIYDTSLFGSFKTDKLKIVEVGGLTLKPGTGITEENWSHSLSHPSLQAFSHLIINFKDQVDPVLSSVCKKLGVKLQTGYSMVQHSDDVTSIDMLRTDF